MRKKLLLDPDHVGKSAEGGSIYMEANSPAQKLWRFYYLRIGRSLLGDWFVLLQYGRKGTSGQRKEKVFQDQEAAFSYASQVVKKRKGAAKRIGVNYILKEDSLGLW